MNHIYRIVWSHARQAWVVVSEAVRGRGKAGGGRGTARRRAWWMLLPLGTPLLAIAAGPLNVAPRAIAAPIPHSVARRAIAAPIPHHVVPRAIAAPIPHDVVRMQVQPESGVMRFSNTTRSPDSVALHQGYGLAVGLDGERAAFTPPNSNPDTLPIPAPLNGNEHANPTGGTVTAGEGSIHQTGNATTIQQDSQHLSLDWLTFDIGADSSVTFLQPNELAIAINRILGNDASTILGRLDANGRVFLINPNGVLFGEGAQVNVGGLVASTLDIDDHQLGSETLRFSGDSTASIVNKGTLTATNGGYVALLGHHVSNQGTIRAQLGTVALAGGNAVTLEFDGGQLASLQVEQSALNALVENRQLIVADGGQVLMTAGAKDSLLASVVNNTGVVQARTVEHRDGRIILLGGMAAGSTHVDGTLDASAPDGGDGGFIETSAAHVQVADEARITTLASDGDTGTWLIDPQDYTIAASGGDITGATLSTNLGTTSVEIQSATGATAGEGDINVDDAVSWSADTVLTLTASDDVNINADLTATGDAAGLVLNPNTANGADAASGDGIYTLNGASITLSGANPSLSIAGQAYIVINSLGAAGSTTGADLQGISGDVTGHYALGSDIDASATAGWNAGAGFNPIGGGGVFSGSFDGLGHTISDLFINRPTTDAVGLFSSTDGSDIRNIGLLGGSVTGQDSVGSLVGQNIGTITQAWATVAVSATNSTAGAPGGVGGLVGLNYGTFSTITQSWASGAVSGQAGVGGLVGVSFLSSTISQSWASGAVSGQTYVGGLVGDNTSSTITQSHASGAVSGSDNVGGLAGGNFGTISQAWATGAVSGDTDVGGLVGHNATGMIDQAHATGTVTATGIRVGGLVGDNDGSITQAYATGTVDGTDIVGGLVGDNDTGTITQAYATGAVSGVNTIGGLVGNDSSGTITQAYATGAVTSTGGISVGGLVGFGFGATITESYWDSYSTGQTTSVQGAAHAGVTEVTSDPAQSAAANYAFTQSAYASFDFTSGTGVWFMVDGSTRPFLQSEYSTTIGNSHQLQLMAMDLDADYTLDDDLDASETGRAVDSALAADAAGMWSNAGFDPIGDLSNRFTGSFDGLGHTISGLTIGLSANDYVGLFGFMDTGSAIRNLGLLGGSVTSNNNYVGALVGYNFGGTISQVYATGAVNGDLHVGGLVGANAGTISQSHASGAVHGNDNIGGLAGRNVNDGTITQAYATGAVDGADAVGGLVGFNAYGTITQAYATGAVDGDSRVGGLAGLNTGAITQTYATGVVVGGSGDGGLVGADFGTIGDSYWATDTTDQATSDGGSGVGVGCNAANYCGLTAAQLIAELPTGFDALVWGNQDNQTTPYLFDNIGPVFVADDLNGVDTNLYTPVLTLDQLQAIDSSLAGNYALFVDLDASATATWNDDGSGNFAGFDPIGDNGNRFTGAFDGLGHTITDLTIDRPSTDYVGLFGYKETGSIIRNLGLLGGSVTGRNYVGGLVGLNDGTIDQAWGTGAVDGNAGVGGLVGYNAGPLSQAYATGAVTGTSNAVGGLVGVNGNLGTITQAYATGAVTGPGTVGGLVGDNFGAISDSYWDTQTTGQATSDGGTAQTTAQLQAGLPVGFNAPVWGIVPGESYPYFLSQFAPGATPQVVSGIVYNDGGATAAAGGIDVSGLIDGSALTSALTGGSVATGANGYYYYLLAPGTLDGSNVLTYVEAAGAQPDGAALADNVGASVANLDIYGDALHAVTSSTALSTVQANLGTAVGLDPVATPLVLGLSDLHVDARGAFAFDLAYILDGDLVLDSDSDDSGDDGGITQAAAIAVTGTSSFDAGTGAIALTNAGNDFGGAVSLSNSGANNVAITDSDGLILGNVNVGTGTLDVQATNLTQAAATSITQAAGAGAASFNAGTGVLTLANTGNDFTGAVDLTGGAAQITDANALALDSVQTTGLTAIADDITLNGAIASTSIDLDASGAIDINTDIANAATSLVLEAGTTVSAQAIDVASFTLQGGTWSQIAATLPTFNATSFTLTGGTFIRAVGGDGSAATPYQLTDIYGVQGIDSAGMLGLDYTLANDIDASGTSGWNGGAGFDPIGDTTTQFTGSFDGLGHTISGLFINRPATNYVGLFGYTDSSTIRNLGLLGSSVTGQNDVGALVGYNQDGTIDQAYATGVVNGNVRVGGLIGQNGGTISQAWATGAVSGDNTVGGLVGYHFGTIDQAYATGAVTGDLNVGGLVGRNRGTIEQAYATGAVTGNGVVGGLVGFNDTGTVSDSYWATDTTGQASSAGGSGAGAGCNAANYCGLTAAQLIAALPTGFDALIWGNQDNQTTPYLLDNVGPVFVADDLTGVGTNLYTPVLTLDQLQAIDSSLAGNYALFVDLDASATATWNDDGSGNFAGFDPIGDSGNQFSGNFDGLGHTITDLTIDRPTTNFVGLFGFADSGSAIRNLGLLGGSVTGRDFVGGLVGYNDTGMIDQSHATGAVSGNDYVGGLVGYNDTGMIDQSHATGAVSGTGNFVGGLVGLNDNGTIDQSHATGAVSGTNSVGGLVGNNYYGTISQTYATGAVSGTNRFVGGLVGYNDYNSAIDQSYATGAVSGNDSVGGLVGNNNQGAISQAYATGAVSGNDSVGGLVGNNNQGAISQTYATGAVTGTTDVGGLIGLSTAGTISSSYWDTQTTGQLTSAGTGATAQTTAQLQAGLPVGFDPAAWDIVAGESYAYFDWQFATGTPQVVSGIVYNDGGTTAAAGGIDVSGLIDGNALTSALTGGNVATGANGYYYYLLAPGTLSGGNDVLTYVETTGAQPDGAALTDNASASVANLDIYGDALHVITSSTALSTVQANLGIAVGLDPVATPLVLGLSDLHVDASGAFAFDLAYSLDGDLVLDSDSDDSGDDGGITQAAAIAVTGTSAFDAGTGAIVLTNTDNDFGGAVSLTGGAVQITDANALTLDSVQTTGLTAIADDITLDGPIASTSIDLAASGMIDINTDIVNAATSLTLEAGTAITAQAIDVASFTLQDGTWSQIAATLPTFSADSFTLAGGTFIRALGGDGSTATPYQLTDIYGVQGIDSVGMLGLDYTLANDIDASGTAGWNGGAGFDPIGDVFTLFTGSFDGLGHTIAGLTIDRPSTDYVGLFGFTGSSTIRNLGLLGGSVAGKDYVGGLVGRSIGTISQSHATGAVNGRGNYVGGLVGDNGGTIDQAWATGAVDGNNRVGGLVGANSNGTIAQAWATGTVSGNQIVGGLVGYNYYGTIDQAYATGAVDGTGNYVGGLVGSNSNGTIDQTYATGAVTGSGTDIGGLVGSNAGAIGNSYWATDTTGQAGSDGGTGLTAAQLIAALPADFDTLVWGNQDNQTTPYLLDNIGPVFVADDLTGPGTNLYTPVLTLDELQAIDSSLAGNYALFVDIDASATATWNDDGSGNFAGFDPIGDDSNRFTGNFDGLGHTITDLTIDRPTTDYVGLFGYTEHSDIRNIGLLGGSVTGQNSVGSLVGLSFYTAITQSYATGAVNGDDIVGGLTGWSDVGTISDSHATGTVNGESRVGGLVGFSTITTITQSHATGAVSGTGSNVGGLVGSNSGTINQAYATGAVSGDNSVGGLVGHHSSGTISQAWATGAVSGDLSVGGLVGFNIATISQAYATGAVSGDSFVGGLAGDNTGTISQAYATGAVSGGGFVGGLVGNSPGTVTNSYWDTQTTGQATSSGGSGVGVDCNAADYCGLATTQMMDPASFAAWGTDISATGGSSADWRIYQGHTAPLLSAFMTDLAVAADDVVVTYNATAFAGSTDYSFGAVAPSIWHPSATVDPGLLLGNANTTAPAIDAGSYALTGDDLYSSQLGYDIAFIAGTLTIDPLAITVVATANDKVYDATTAATASLASAGILGADVVSFTSTSASFDDKHAGVGKTVTVTGIAASGADAGNYSVNASDTDTADISQLAITVAATADDKVYDATTAATASLASAGILGADVVSFTHTSASFADKNAGTGKTVTVTGIAAGGADAGNYSINTSDTDTADISQLAITVAATADDKVYDATTAATATLASTGVIAGDTVTFTGTGAFDNKNAGAGKTVTVTGIAAGGADGGNYSVNASDTDTADISQRAITVDATASDKVYDATTAATASLASSGILAGDMVTFTGTGAFDNKNAGTGKTVTVTGIAAGGVDGGNYSVNASDTDTADISQLGITVDATASDKVYDATTAATASLASSGILAGDTVTFTGTGAFDNKNAGTGKTVTVTGIAAGGTDGGNYSVNASDTDTADISQRAITVAATADDKVYDATTAATATLASTGVIAGDTVTFTGTGAFDNKNAGAGKTVTVTGIAAGGADGGNYSVNSSDTDTADISQRAITVDATASDKVYDATTAATASLASTGVIAGDTVTFTGTGTFDNKNAGTGKTVTVTGIATGGTDGGNYSVNASDTDTADISQRAITVVATADDKVYDATTAATASLASGGILAGDTVTFTGTGTFADKNAGVDKTVTVTGIAAGGADAGNYSINTSDTDTADISQLAITVAATADDKVYDATTAATASLASSGILAGDTVTFTGTGAFDNKNAGTDKTVTVTGIAAGGTDGGNYSVNTSDTDTADINQLGITVDATASDKVYDATTAATASLASTGILTGDTVTFTGTGAFDNKNAGTGKTVTVTGIAAGGTDGGNYSVNASDTDTADISQRAITVDATASDKVYDATTAATASLASTGVLGTDVVSFTSTSASFDNKNAGTGKTVTVTGIATGGTDGGNYSVNASDTDTADISQKTITVDATASDKVYDGTTAATASLAATGVIAGDDIGFASGSATFDDKNAGADKTVTVSGIAASGADAGNYSVNTTDTDTADISQKAITVDATASDKVYDATTAATATLASDGVIAGDTVTFTGTGTFDNKNAGTGKTVTVTGIAAGGADGGNYSVNASDTDTADISQLGITVDATADDKVYDATTAATASLASSGILAGDSVTFTGTGAFDNKNAGTDKTVTVTGIATGGTDGGNYSVNTSDTDTADITPATLTYVADPASLFVGQPPTGLTGSVDGLVADETLDEATDGAATWTTPATADSTAGIYAIDGGGLTAGNYVFVQAPDNATALTLANAGAPFAVDALVAALQMPTGTDTEGNPDLKPPQIDRDDDQAQGLDITIVDGGVRMP